jgi:tRNA (guanine-N(7)-)-methyltransferase
LAERGRVARVRIYTKLLGGRGLIWRCGPTSMARLRKSRKFIGDSRSVDLQDTGPGAGAEYFSIEPERFFANAAPLEVELGSGKGDFILERARQFPQHNFLAIELAGSVFQWLALQVVRSKLDNLRALRADARPAVNLMLPGGAVRAFHIYFPDPWPKSRHSKHRLFTPSTVVGLARCLESGGRIYVATDVDWYFDEIVDLFARQGFRLAPESVSGARRTNFGRRFAAAGTAIHAGCFQLEEADARLSDSSSQVTADV